MKASVVTINGEKARQAELPSQFSEEVRKDLIKRAVLAIQSHKRQPYGSKRGAGLRSSADVSRRRRRYRGSYGIGISRVPRKVMSRSGTRMNWTGAVAPGTIGGRRAFPPTMLKEWAQKINRKERKKAIRSAISGTVSKAHVKERNHFIPKDYPLVVETKAESLSKTKEVFAFLEKAGFKEELERVSEKKIRAGIGKMRGRKYKKKVGPLIVVSGDCNLLKAGRNIPGVDVVKVNELNAELLAPGCVPGRLTLWSEAAVQKMGKEKMFQ